VILVAVDVMEKYYHKYQKNTTTQLQIDFPSNMDMQQCWSVSRHLYCRTID